MAAIIRRRPGEEDRSRSTVALPPRAPAAASESEAELSSSVAARDLMISVAYGSSTASGSTSGTSWTTYTSSRSSTLSSVLDLASQLHQCFDDEEEGKRRERAMRLVKEFHHRDGDISALERWLSEMDVGWVLDLADDPSAWTSLLRAQPQRNNLAERWIRALTEITEFTHLEYVVRGMDVPSRVQLFRIFKATVLKILPFVGALLAAADLDTSTDTAGVSSTAQAPSEKLQALLGVRGALSSTSERIRLCFDWFSSAEIEAEGSKLLNLLSGKKHRLEEAIWNTMEVVRYSILSDNDDDDTEGGYSDFARITRHSQAAELGIYVPNRDIISSFLLSVEQDEIDPLTTLTLEMVFSLEVKLAKRSESFPDHSLRFLFLINNTHFIQQQLHLLFSMQYRSEVLTPKIEDYIQKYMQVSWAPVMSCLNNDTPHCFKRNFALPKFDSEFQKTYTAQKLWKVPDPELRTRLRKVIAEKVVSGLTRYLENNNVTSPEVNPQEWEKMLLELFEG